MDLEKYLYHLDLIKNDIFINKQLPNFPESQKVKLDDKINKKKNSMHNSDENLQKEEKLDDDNNINNEVNSFESDFIIF